MGLPSGARGPVGRTLVAEEAAPGRSRHGLAKSVGVMLRTWFLVTGEHSQVPQESHEAVLALELGSFVIYLNSLLGVRICLYPD